MEREKNGQGLSATNRQLGFRTRRKTMVGGLHVLGGQLQWLTGLVSIHFSQPPLEGRAVLYSTTLSSRRLSQVSLVPSSTVMDSAVLLSNVAYLAVTLYNPLFDARTVYLSHSPVFQKNKSEMFFFSIAKTKFEN